MLSFIKGDIKWLTTKLKMEYVGIQRDIKNGEGWSRKEMVNVKIVELKKICMPIILFLGK